MDSFVEGRDNMSQSLSSEKVQMRRQPLQGKNRMSTSFTEVLKITPETKITTRFLETILSAEALVKTSMKVDATITYVTQPGPLLTSPTRLKSRRSNRSPKGEDVSLSWQFGTQPVSLMLGVTAGCPEIMRTQDFYQEHCG